LKELSRAVNAFIPSPTLPLPDDLHYVIDAYLQKHERYDEGSSGRLHDEFLSIYQKHVRDYPSRLGAFVSILRSLLPIVRTSSRLLQWWDLLCEPILEQEAQDRGLASESFDAMVEILMSYNSESEDSNADSISNPFAERLLAVWIDKYNPAPGESNSAVELRERRVRDALSAFGKRRPKVRDVCAVLGQRSSNAAIGVLGLPRQILPQEGLPKEVAEAAL
jgi:hypothetical protein